MTVRLRAATPADNAELEVLIERSTRALLRPFLSREQIAASLELMTLDHALIEEPTSSRRTLALSSPAAAGAGGANTSRLPGMESHNAASSNPLGTRPAYGPCTPIPGMRAGDSGG